jgi:hypothetical protein
MTSAALLALALTAADPPSDADLKKRAEALVAQLGDPDYRDRERAARELLAIGYPAKDAVLAGERSADQEVSDRCQKLYPVIWRTGLEKRVQKFLDDPDGPIPDDLPAAGRWLKLAGDGKASRDLYGEMVKAHAETLLDVELHPDRTLTVYQEHVRQRFPRVTEVTGRVTTGPAPADVLLFLFLGAAGDVRPAFAPGTSSSHYMQFLSSSFLGSKLSDTDAGVPVRKLYAAWLEKERYAIMLRRGMDVAARHKVTECIPTVLKLAGQPDVLGTYRATALLGLAKLGTKENLKDLEPFLTNKTQIATVTVNSEPWTVQMRDVALGAAVLLAGQNPADFGFERRPPSTPLLTSYAYYAFSEDEKRDAAHRKWKEWAEKNLSKK